MKPVFEQARASLKRVAYAEGEEESVLRAVQTVVDEGLARPILIGRASVIAMRIERLGLRIREGVDFDLTNIDDDRAIRTVLTQALGRQGHVVRTTGNASTLDRKSTRLNSSH